ncbi:MAG TPA: SRPBCC domain-containing protein, partial [Polyangiaceae bacterium]|nr:SRPBCC domain-containing protein [Polyangiaceae bacterium]
MATDSLRISTVIQASPEQIYEAWLDSEQHARMTGGPASVDRAPGGRFSAWDGYIQGTTLEVEPGRRIVQSWRTTEFPADSPDSRVEIHLAPHESGGSLITVVHADIPEGDGPKYQEGWDKFYFGPMKDHFAKVAQGAGREAAAPDAGGGGEDVAATAPDAGGGGEDVA